MTRARADERLARRGGAIELLRIPSALFAGVARLRNALYDRGLLPIERLDTPVIGVGNLTAGGTGKTPAVIFVARELARRGLRPGVLSRGYRRGKVQRSDEGALLGRALPGVPIVEDRNRVAGGRRLETLGVDAIVLDDGFQHRRLARELDLVLIDATRPYGLPAPPGGGPPVRCALPRGLLREPPRSLTRAHAILVTRCDQVDERELHALEAALRELAPGVALLRAVHRPVALRSGGDTLPLDALRDRAVQLVSGIGNPQAFERTARALGARVLGVHCFPDHHAFRPPELAPIRAAGGELLATAKDAVKLEELGVPCLVLEVELALVSGSAVLHALLDALTAGRGSRERASLHAGLAG